MRTSIDLPYHLFMVRAVSKEEFLAAVPDILSSGMEDLVIIQQGTHFVAALIGEKEFQQLRQARGRRAVAAMDRISDAIEASGVGEQELKDLEAALDRKA